MAAPGCRGREVFRGVATTPGSAFAAKVEAPWRDVGDPVGPVTQCSARSRTSPGSPVLRDPRDLRVNRAVDGLLRVGGT